MRISNAIIKKIKHINVYVLEGCLRMNKKKIANSQMHGIAKANGAWKKKCGKTFLFHICSYNFFSFSLLVFFLYSGKAEGCILCFHFIFFFISQQAAIRNKKQKKKLRKLSSIKYLNKIYILLKIKKGNLSLSRYDLNIPRTCYYLLVNIH